MYAKRLKIFAALCIILLAVCMVRLAQMQLVASSYYRSRIAELQHNESVQLTTVRGRILDRNGCVLAVNEPGFELCINYELALVGDNRYRQAELIKAENRGLAAVEKTKKDLESRRERLESIVRSCAAFYGVQPSSIENRIGIRNHRLWARRTYLAWLRNCPDSKLLSEYDNIEAIPISEVIADFEKHFPTARTRLLMVSKVPLADLQPEQSWPLMRLRTDDDVLAAQLAFIENPDVQVEARPERVYPYATTAAQTISWVGPVHSEGMENMFSEDRLRAYQQGELNGRGGGAEYVCEALLRGRRGELVFNFDDELVQRTERQFGTDVNLTLDIELQSRVEDYMADAGLNPNYDKPTSAVILDVAGGDILALVSMPSFDLNEIRTEYAEIASNANQPMRNRALNKWYPPGSVIKPLVLIAGLEEGEIEPEEVISCPAEPAPKGWPNCWIFNRYRVGHDNNWENKARNAIKGSCNIYFSRLADRIDSSALQEWLYKFGYGRRVLETVYSFNVSGSEEARNFAQLAGVISSSPPEKEPRNTDELPPLAPGEKRFFGIGQGNLRVTPLQVANAMAVIARNGLYTAPRLVMTERSTEGYDSVDLNIDPDTLAVVRDGMQAVVNEEGGTAYNQFMHSGFSEQGVTVYGKTGSTEAPDNAWFAGFGEDELGRAISLAVVIEGGQHGSSDAGPVARNILQFCVDAGYIGRTEGK